MGKVLFSVCKIFFSTTEVILSVGYQQQTQLYASICDSDLQSVADYTPIFILEYK